MFGQGMSLRPAKFAVSVGHQWHWQPGGYSAQDTSLPTCSACLYLALRDVLQQQLPRWPSAACRVRPQRRAEGPRRAPFGKAAPKALPASGPSPLLLLLLLQARTRSSSMLLGAPRVVAI